MVENFGLYLKHERELRGVPLEEIAGTTKIHIRFLQALENNNFDELPGEVFIKGYIRCYAKTIGSDVDEMLNAYDQLMGKKEISVEEVEENVTLEGSKKPVVEDKKYYLGYLIVGIIVVGLVVAGYFLFFKALPNMPEKAGTSTGQFQNTSAQVADPVSNEFSSLPEIREGERAMGTGGPAKYSDETNNEVMNDSGNPGAREEISNTVGGPARAPMEETSQETSQADRKTGVTIIDASHQGTIDAEKLQLVIRANQDSWFNMTVDNLREQDFILTAGTEKIFYGNEQFRITVGNTKGTELYLNGKVVAMPEDPGMVLKDFMVNSQLIE